VRKAGTAAWAAAAASLAQQQQQQQQQRSRDGNGLRIERLLTPSSARLYRRRTAAFSYARRPASQRATQLGRKSWQHMVGCRHGQYIYFTVTVESYNNK